MFSLYTTNPEVTKVLNHVFFVFSFGYIGTWLRNVLGNILNAINKQRWVTVYYLVCYLLIGHYLLLRDTNCGFWSTWSLVIIPGSCLSARFALDFTLVDSILGGASR